MAKSLATPSPRKVLEDAVHKAVATSEASLRHGIGKSRTRILASVLGSLEEYKKELIKAVQHEVAERVERLGVSEGGLLQSTIALVARAATRECQNSLLRNQIRSIRTSLSVTISRMLDGSVPVTKAPALADSTSEQPATVDDSVSHPDPTPPVSHPVVVIAPDPSAYSWDDKEFRETFVPEMLMSIASNGLIDLLDRITRLNPPILTADEEVSNTNYLLLQHFHGLLAEWLAMGIRNSAARSEKSLKAFRKSLLRKLDGIPQSVEQILSSPEIKEKPQSPHPDVLTVVTAVVDGMKNAVNELREGPALASVPCDSAAALPEPAQLFLPRTMDFLEERFLDPSKRWVWSDHEAEALGKMFRSHHSRRTQHTIEHIAVGMNEDHHGGMFLVIDDKKIFPITAEDVREKLIEMGLITQELESNTPIDVPEPSKKAAAEESAGPVPPAPVLEPISVSSTGVPGENHEPVVPGAPAAESGLVTKIQPASVKERNPEVERQMKVEQIIREELGELIAKQIWPTEREIQHTMYRINDEAYGGRSTLDRRDPMSIVERRANLLGNFHGVRQVTRFARPDPVPNSHGEITEFDPEFQDKMHTEFCEVEAEVDAFLLENLPMTPSRNAIIAQHISASVYDNRKVWKLDDLEEFIKRFYQRRRRAGQIATPPVAEPVLKTDAVSQPQAEGIAGGSAHTPASIDGEKSMDAVSGDSPVVSSEVIISQADVSSESPVAQSVLSDTIAAVAAAAADDSLPTSDGGQPDAESGALSDASPIPVDSTQRTDDLDGERAPGDIAPVPSALLEMQRRMCAVYASIHANVPTLADLESMEKELAAIRTRRVALTIERNQLDTRLYEHQMHVQQACQRQEQAKTIDPKFFAADRALLKQYLADLDAWSSIPLRSSEDAIASLEKGLREHRSVLNAVRHYRMHLQAIVGNLEGLDLVSIFGMASAVEEIALLDARLDGVRDGIVGLEEVEDEGTQTSFFALSASQVGALQHRIGTCLTHMEDLLHRVLHPGAARVPAATIAPTQAALSPRDEATDVDASLLDTPIDPSHEEFVHRVLAIVSGPKEVGNNGNGLSISSRIGRILQTFYPHGNIPADCVVDAHDAAGTVVLRQYADVSPEAQKALAWMSNGREEDAKPKGTMRIDQELLQTSQKPFLLHFNHKGSLVLAVTAVGARYAAQHNIVLSANDISVIAKHLAWSVHER